MPGSRKRELIFPNVNKSVSRNLPDSLIHIIDLSDPRGPIYRASDLKSTSRRPLSFYFLNDNGDLAKLSIYGFDEAFAAISSTRFRGELSRLYSRQLAGLLHNGISELNGRSCRHPINQTFFAQLTSILSIYNSPGTPWLMKEAIREACKEHKKNFDPEFIRQLFLMIVLVLVALLVVQLLTNMIGPDAPIVSIPIFCIMALGATMNIDPDSYTDAQLKSNDKFLDISSHSKSTVISERSAMTTNLWSFFGGSPSLSQADNALIPAPQPNA